VAVFRWGADDRCKIVTGLKVSSHPFSGQLDERPKLRKRLASTWIAERETGDFDAVRIEYRHARMLRQSKP